jgi:Lon protease-like protein
MATPSVLPVFALHTVLFPGLPMALRVFEERYLSLLDEVLPDGTFVVAAILSGREVAGPAEPFRVGVTVGIADHDVEVDGSVRLEVQAVDRVALIEPVASDSPFPRWRIAPYPDEGGAGTDDVEAAADALRRYLVAIGEDARPIVPHDPVTASWAIAAAVPGLVPDRQALLEIPGAGERLTRARERLAIEARIVSTLGSGVAGADPAINPN